jgi:hypothetical protein
MEFQTSEFNLEHWLTKWLGTDMIENNANFEVFAKEIYTNINHFARQNKTDLINYFSQFSLKANQKLRTHLSNEITFHLEWEDTHTLRKAQSTDKVHNDICDLITLTVASPTDVKSKNLSSLYDIKQNDKISITDMQQLYDLLSKNIATNHKIVIQQLKSSKSVIGEQNKIITNLQKANDKLQSELSSAQKKLDTINDKLNNKNLFSSFPVPPTENTNSYSRTVSLNLNPQVSQATPVTNKKRPNTDSEQVISNSSAKKPLYSNMTNRNSNTQTQKTLYNFNSFDKNSKNTTIGVNKKNEGFTVAGEKENLKRQRNFQKKQYNKSVGLGSNDESLARKRKFFVYFGNIDLSATEEKVKQTLVNILDGIEFDDFIELNKDMPEKKFKSFKFSIGYLDKDVINDKARWPKYTIVNKYKLSKTEWDTISAKFKDKTAKSSGTNLFSFGSSTTTNSTTMTNNSNDASSATASASKSNNN